jgi:hypothetical protein
VGTAYLSQQRGPGRLILPCPAVVGQPKLAGPSWAEAAARRPDMRPSNARSARPSIRWAEPRDAPGGELVTLPTAGGRTGGFDQLLRKPKERAMFDMNRRVSSSCRSGCSRWRERETVWPRRLHQVAGGDAGGDLEWWRIVGRDAVVFPEVVAVADALMDPAMAELVWVDSGAGRPRALPVDGMFCRRLGERLGRAWLGPLAAAPAGRPGTTTTRGGCGRSTRPRPWPASCGCWARRRRRPVRGRCGGRSCAAEPDREAHI